LNLYDVNGDGFIGVDEMLAYLTAVFRVLHASSAAADVIRAAARMADRLFDVFDANDDNFVDFSEL
ncbi:unnamed protein product, partial [Phaeothamnion confervicola]